MCLLVAKREGNWLPSREEFDNAWTRNPHGWGAAWIDQRRGLVYAKTTDKERAYNTIKGIPEDSPALFHWRLATNGSKTDANCHPWPCYGGRYVGAHNGVLYNQPISGDKTDSESYLMSLKGEPNVKSIERDIARLGYGKIALIGQNGRILIANETHPDCYEYRDGVWVSNDSMEGRVEVPWWQRDWDNPAKKKKSIWAPQRDKSPVKRGLTRLKCDWCDSERIPEWQTEDGIFLCSECEPYF